MLNIGAFIKEKQQQQNSSTRRSWQDIDRGHIFDRKAKNVLILGYFETG